MDFEFTQSQSGSIFIQWKGKTVTTLKGRAATKFLLKVSSCTDEEQRQVVMAKITGNFKRGNEKDNQ